MAGVFLAQEPGGDVPGQEPGQQGTAAEDALWGGGQRLCVCVCVWGGGRGVREGGDEGVTNQTRDC